MMPRHPSAATTTMPTAAMTMTTATMTIVPAPLVTTTAASATATAVTMTATGMTMITMTMTMTVPTTALSLAQSGKTEGGCYLSFSTNEWFHKPVKNQFMTGPGPRLVQLTVTNTY